MADERIQSSADSGPLHEQIILQPQAKAPPAPTPQPKSAPKPGPPEMKDGFREIVETVVFVVVLVLMLKTFLAEAFVIPTGSMATTLLGYHREATCEKCGYTFTVNVSKEVDPQDGRKETVIGGYCPNCRYLNPLKRQAPAGGAGP
ncbi:MAG: S26 family signal peptidase [Gemmataceae bacterium]|nr:S26 family signal peptidase [Gemmataceae bacterium]MCI0737919.1 S26 family signal peptidase [Gemmataceae bacterium]